jgi:hypothetical protein
LSRWHEVLTAPFDSSVRCPSICCNPSLPGGGCC